MKEANLRPQMEAIYYTAGSKLKKTISLGEWCAVKLQ